MGMAYTSSRASSSMPRGCGAVFWGVAAKAGLDRHPPRRRFARLVPGGVQPQTFFALYASPQFHMASKMGFKL